MHAGSGPSQELDPQAQPVSYSLSEGGNISFVLGENQLDGLALHYEVVTLPVNGKLEGTAPSLTYIPNQAFFGDDFLEFVAKDAVSTSSPAKIVFKVQSKAFSPVADDQAISVVEDTSKNLILTGSDPNNDPLIFYITSAPIHGTLLGTVPNLTYQPNADFFGTDRFKFKVSDGELESAEATVSIQVTGVSDPPRALPQTVGLLEDTPKSIRLTGNDPDGTTPSFLIVLPPNCGIR